MKEFPPNINPELFSLSAILVGLIIEDDYTADELESIGNWLFLVAQFVLTTAAQQSLINSRYQKNYGSRIRSNSQDHSIMNEPYVKESDLNALYQRMQELEKNLKN